MKFHYILTTQIDGQVRTQHGRIAPVSGSTRTAVLGQLLHQMSLPPGVLILFFSLEPDDLGVTS